MKEYCNFSVKYQPRNFSRDNCVLFVICLNIFDSEGVEAVLEGRSSELWLLLSLLSFPSVSKNERGE